MARIIETLDEIAAQYDVLYCDLWGCVHDGTRAWPEAIAALERFRAGSGSVVLMTNSPRPSAGVEHQIAQLGVPRGAWDVIVTSGDASQEAMLRGAVGRRIWHLGPEKDDAFFTDVPEGFEPVERVEFNAAEGIVCTGPFDDATDHPDDYRGRFLSAKARELKLLCANPDIVVDLGDQRIWCAGALAELYEQMGGESLYFGKPYPPIYDLARRKLAALEVSVETERTLSVGDGINTDIRGGVGEGIDTLFITGGLEAARFGPDPEHPDPEKLATWLDAIDTPPLLSMGRLR